MTTPVRAVTTSATDGADFVAHTEAAFTAAAKRAGASSHEIQLGTATLRIRLAGDALHEALLSAFAHRLLSDGTSVAAPELEIRAWDAQSTGIFAPRAPWAERDFLARGEVKHSFESGVQLSFRIDSGVLSVFDPRNNVAWCWVRDPQQLPPWELAAPIRPILGWWASHTNRQLAHGAAVGTTDGAVLLSARGGAGKSTTALSALERGLMYVGDDYVLLESPESPWASSLYCTAKVQPDNLAQRLPDLAAMVAGDVDQSQDKVTLDLRRRFSSQLVDRLPLRAMLIPHVSGSEEKPWLEPVTPATVLAALAPTTVFQLPGAGGASLARMGAFVASLPGYRLHLSTNLDDNVALIQTLIRERAVGA